MLELNPITLNDDYRKKWNISCHDFLHLCKDGVKLNDTLYRVGGMGGMKDVGKDYVMLLKYEEALYPLDNIIKDKKSQFHLQDNWCIIDKHGVEKVVFESFQHGYLQGGQVYSMDSKYYNIETGECYGDSYSTIKSEHFLFIENIYDKDKSKRGVIKINKKDGTFELFN